MRIAGLAELCAMMYVVYRAGLDLQQRRRAVERTASERADVRTSMDLTRDVCT